MDSTSGSDSIQRLVVDPASDLPPRLIASWASTHDRTGRPSPSRDRLHRATCARRPLRNVGVTPHAAHPQPLHRLREPVLRRQLRDALPAEPTEHLTDLRRADNLRVHLSDRRRPVD
jgi:hypothetical protein